jgi:hypothetical protein
MKTMIAVTLALAALMLGLDKVRNEHRMTEMYERQAVALESIADTVALREALDDKHPLSRAMKVYPIKPAYKNGDVRHGMVWLDGDWRTCMDGLRVVPCYGQGPMPKGLTTSPSAWTPDVINGRKASDFPDHDANCARYSAPTADGMQMCWEPR